MSDAIADFLLLSLDARADMARQVLGSPALAWAWHEIEQDAIAAWRGTEPDELNVREHAHRRLKSIAALRAKLESVLSDEKMAERQAKVRARGL